MAAWPLTALRVLLGCSLCAYVLYALLSVWAARQWSRAARAPSSDWTPAVTILKPVRGVDAEAWENFASFCRLDYPPDRVQILFGALDADDPALDLARRLQTEFPDLDIGIVTAPSGLPRGNNRKVCNLLNMLPHAKHEILVLCDSDMRVRPDYLRRIVAPFEGDPRPVGLVTCPYRGERALSFAAAIEALSIGADFIPSTLVSRAMEGVTFALGSTIVIPRRVLERIGGFEPLLDELADDFRLGNAVHNAGCRVVLSDYVIDDILGREQFSAMWSRRLRWARTLRACRPSGYVGMFITYGFPLAVLFLVAMGFGAIGWAVLAVVAAIRLATALTIALCFTGDRAVLRFLPLLPVSDLLGAALYVISFFGSHIHWRGERFRLLPGGRLLRED